ncbi:MAG: hypothetical protein LBQ79_10795 [Deltaproteobacteria bacterium]|nr:hypothetical protein [Deltaproteobacteria bacterium]
MAKRIAVDQARPGQILAEEITRQDGVLLASRASEVTEGLIRMLGRMNVDTVVIEEAEQRTEEDIRGEHAEEVARIARVFRRAGDSPVLAALRRTLVFMSEQERDKALEFLELSREPEAPEDGGSADGNVPGAAPEAGAGAVQKPAGKLETVDEPGPRTKAPVKLETADEPASRRKAPVRLETADEPAPRRKAPGKLETAGEPGPRRKAPVKLETAGDPGPRRKAPVKLETADEPAPRRKAPVRLETADDPGPRPGVAGKLETPGDSRPAGAAPEVGDGTGTEGSGGSGGA